MKGDEITIAITVYDRCDYLSAAIRSALAQNTKERPQVIVVEDCGPDKKLRETIIAEFGDRIRYYRNSRRRGLSDNWNACIDACRTPWLCILHDDDLLEPNFAEAMGELAEAAPGRALYYGQCDVMNQAGQIVEARSREKVFAWHQLALPEWARYDPVCFPAQLFNVAAAREVGGFRPRSNYTADWEMWFKLNLKFGSAATNRVVAKYREHYSVGRGTSLMNITGRKYAYGNMQRKRHASWLHETDSQFRFDRARLLKKEPMSIRFILDYAHGFSPRMLRYNAGLLYRSSAPHARYWLFQIAAILFSPRSLRPASRFYHRLRHRKFTTVKADA